MLLEAVEAREDERCFRARVRRLGLDWLGRARRGGVGSGPRGGGSPRAWLCRRRHRHSRQFLSGLRAEPALALRPWPWPCLPLVQVGDFGLAKAAKGAITVANFGTVSHMSPGAPA